MHTSVSHLQNLLDSRHFNSRKRNPKQPRESFSHSVECLTLDLHLEDGQPNRSKRMLVMHRDQERKAETARYLDDATVSMER
jgi:hypothetical protein